MSVTGGQRESIAAPVADVATVLLDFAHYADWQRVVSSCRVLEGDAPGDPETAGEWLVEMVIDAKVRRLRLVTRYTFTPPGDLHSVLESGDLKAFDGTYELTDDGGTTTAALDIAVDVGFFVPGRVMRSIRDQVLRSSLRELRSRVEGQ